MKKFFRKANRGLILGGLLTAGLTIYIITDLNNFKTEKPLIEETVKEYASALSDFNITPEKYRELNVKYSAEDSEKRIKEFAGFTDKYWLSVDDAVNEMFGWASLKEDFAESMKLVTDDISRGYITEFSVDLSGCKINKDGPGCAVMTCDASIYFEGTENCAIICPGGYDNSYQWTDDESTAEPEVVKTSLTQECTFNLERTSDGWKITRCEFYDNECDIVYINEEETVTEAADSSENE